MSERISHETLPINSVIDTGSVVEIYFKDIDETETFQLVGMHDEGNTGAASDTISVSSPLGKEILGKSEGYEGSYVTPNGGAIAIKIRSVR